MAHSRAVSKFFQHLKTLGFYLGLFFQVLTLVRGQELTKTGHKQVLLNPFSLLAHAVIISLQSQSLDPHKIKCRYFDPSSALKS